MLNTHLPTNGHIFYPGNLYRLLVTVAITLIITVVKKKALDGKWV